MPEDSMSKANASLTQTAQETILGMIQDGQLVHGTVIRERDLADQFGLSRIPVREALSRLEGGDFLRRSGRTLLVNGVALGDLLEILVVRILLETEAACVAATRMPLSVISSIKSRIEAMNDAKSVDSMQHWNADQELHTPIAHASSNGLLERMIADCRLRTGMFGMERIPSRFESGRAQHLTVLGALHERDAGGRLMDAHIENAKLAIVRAVTGAADL